MKVGERIPSHEKLAEQFKVSMKTIHSAIKLLEKEEMILSDLDEQESLETNLDQQVLMIGNILDKILHKKSTYV